MWRTGPGRGGDGVPSRRGGGILQRLPGAVKRVSLEGEGERLRSPSPPRYLPVAPPEDQQPTSDEQGTGAQRQQRGADGDTTGLRQVFLLLLRHAFLLG